MNMNKLKFFSAALMASAFASHAQDINQAKKAVDAEQFESAKSILKSIIKEKQNEKKYDKDGKKIRKNKNDDGSKKKYIKKDKAKAFWNNI